MVEEREETAWLLARCCRCVDSATKNDLALVNVDNVLYLCGEFCIIKCQLNEVCAG